jgi:hypothetical protein
MPVEKFSKDYGKGMNIKMAQQDTLIEELKALAKSQRTVVGRIMKFQMADSYAFYIVANVQKFIAELKWIRYCDEWVDDRLGKKGTLPMEYVYGVVKTEDEWERMFPPRKTPEKFILTS